MQILEFAENEGEMVKCEKRTWFISKIEAALIKSPNYFIPAQPIIQILEIAEKQGKRVNRLQKYSYKIDLVQPSPAQPSSPNYFDPTWPSDRSLSQMQILEIAKTTVTWGKE